MTGTPQEGTLGALLRTAAAAQPTRLASLNRIRAEALERANTLSLPTTRDEEWRFTSLAPLAEISFQPPVSAPELAPTALAGVAMPEAAGRLVFVDGVLDARQSAPVAAGGLSVMTLRDALERCPELLDAHLARHARHRDSVFAALNTAFLRDGVLVHVPRGCAVAAPLHVLHVATRQAAPHAMYPRLLLVAERDSECTLVEEHVAIGDGVYLVAGVTEVVVGENAEVRHVRVQQDGASAFNISRCTTVQARASRYRSWSVAAGARISRLDLDVIQEGEATETWLDGLALINGRQLADTHTFLDHAKPRGRSRQVHRTVAGGQGHAVFNGKILVRKGAQQTDSSQSSRNLLLSARAHVDTKPQLEIFADDVKCAHGATVGQLEDEEVFYLRSRGLSAEAARSLLTYAFAAEVIDRIPVPSLAARLREVVMTHTKG